MQRVAVALLALFLLAALVAAEAQPAKKVPRVGFLSTDAAADSSAAIDAFRQGLRELGRIEGQNIAIEWRFAAARWDRLATLATELVGLSVDLAVTNDALAARSLRAASPTVPIVLAGADLLWSQIGNIARPGGNITEAVFPGRDRARDASGLVTEHACQPCAGCGIVLARAHPSGVTSEEA